jgi:hypothetical protein
MEGWKIAVIVVVIVAVLALGLGLGLGLGLKPGSATFAMTNATGTTAAHLLGVSSIPTETPNYFGMKMIAVYIVPDIDPVTSNPKGYSPLIWLNSQCNGDIANCSIQPPYTNIVTNFFDFSKGTESVNAFLNSQPISIPPGTYKYIKMEFCKSKKDIMIIII